MHLLYRTFAALAFAGVLSFVTFDSAPTEEAAVLETATGTIHGTLLLPAESDPMPVVLIIAGSGPTNRDGNSIGLPGANNSLKLLAEGLAGHGIATLRYDKRGVAESMAAGPSEGDLRFEHYVEDAAAWVELLRGDDRFDDITVLGHSEGALIGMLAARSSSADAFISVAGPGRRASDILREQLRQQLSDDLWDESERILGELEKGETADSVPAALYMLYRPSVQPYMISFLRYDPTAELARLAKPILIAQGTTDLQVTLEDAQALHAASSEAQLHVIEGMNHVLKVVDDDMATQMASYGDPALPVAPELIEAVSVFIRDR